MNSTFISLAWCNCTNQTYECILKQVRDEVLNHQPKVFYSNFIVGASLSLEFLTSVSMTTKTAAMITS